MISVYRFIVYLSTDRWLYHSWKPPEAMKVTGNLSNSTNNSQQRASSTTVRVSVHYKVYLVKHENNF